MKKNYLFLILLISLIACQKNDFGLFDCLNDQIENFKNGNYACAEGANVKEYEFLGEKVYVFDPGICGADFTSEVIDENCNSLGFLGGIIGNGEISGTNFSEAVFIKVIWKR